MDAADVSNLSALGALITLVLWAVTSGLPRLLLTAETREQRTRDEFRAMAEKSQAVFRDALHDLLEESRAQRISCVEENAKLRTAYGEELKAQRLQLHDWVTRADQKSDHST